MSLNDRRSDPEQRLSTTPSGRTGRVEPRHFRIIGWTMAVMLWGASAINYSTGGPLARNGHVKGGDYAHFYIMARFAAHRQGAALYDDVAQKEEFGRALPGVETPNYLPFLYGPQAALLLAPFGVLPYFPSLLLWWSAATLVYLAACRAVWRASPLLQSYPKEVALLAIAYPGLWELFIYGHTSWIALGCLTIFYFGVRRDRWWLSGVAVGVLAYKPQLGFGVCVVLLAMRNWRVILAAAVTVAVQALACWMWFGPEVFAAYARMLSTLPTIAPLVEPQQFQLCSIRGFFTGLGVSGSTATLLSLGPTVMVCWWMIEAWRRRPLSVGFAVLLMATILISPHETVYDLVLLAPALLLLADRSLASGGSGRLRVLLALAYMLPVTGAIARVTHVQLVTPVLMVLIYVAVRVTVPTGGVPPAGRSVISV